ncbi:50S ribosomal protein L6 [Candidatus Nomurabacteria bacterium]|nr:50S ribosomal protein L6 [Candidatus Nomurabacteria bacterium]
MSRVGKQTIELPQGVTASVDDGMLKVKGPKGELTRSIHELVTVSINDNVITVDVVNKENKFERSLWGTFAAHAKNMVEGVTSGFQRQLEINGVGYKVALQGKDLKIEVGYSHPVMYKAAEGITFSVEKNVITIDGFDKELVGRTASEIRAIRKPEPYKGKGIKYMEETIRRKAGKTAKA